MDDVLSICDKGNCRTGTAASIDRGKSKLFQLRNGVFVQSLSGDSMFPQDIFCLFRDIHFAHPPSALEKRDVSSMRWYYNQRKFLLHAF